MNKKKLLELKKTIIKGNFPAYQQCVRDNPDVMAAVLNDLNQEAIHLAAELNFFQLIEFIVSIDPSRINATDGMGQTPLMIAASQGHVRSVQCLVDHRAPLDITYSHRSAPSYQLTALDLAIEKGHLAVVDVLIEAGALDCIQSYNKALDLVEQIQTKADVILKNANIMHLLYEPKKHPSLSDDIQHYYRKAGRRPSFCADIDWNDQNVTVFKAKKTLGCGHFGAVREFTSLQGQSRAVKSIEFFSVTEEKVNDAIEKIRRESSLMKRAYDAPSFCGGFFIQSNKMSLNRCSARIVMPLVQGKCAHVLFDEIRCEHTVAQIISYMAQEIIALHEKGIVHGDIKQDNILIYFNNGSYHVTLVDFGSAECLATPQSVMVTSDENAIYWAPERILAHVSQPFTPIAPQKNQDVFSFGFMLGILTKPYEKKLARSYPSIAQFIQDASNPIPSKRPLLTSFCTELVIEIGEHFMEYDKQLVDTMNKSVRR